MNRPRASDVLEPWELDAVVDWFLYRLTMADREYLMRDLPHTYNRLVGRNVLEVCLEGADGVRRVLEPRDDS
jgi:hypothetical protein